MAHYRAIEFPEANTRVRQFDKDEDFFGRTRLRPKPFISPEGRKQIFAVQVGEGFTHDGRFIRFGETVESDRPLHRLHPDRFELVAAEGEED
jgi:hypothetical protein